MVKKVKVRKEAKAKPAKPGDIGSRSFDAWEAEHPLAIANGVRFARLGMGALRKFMKNGSEDQLAYACSLFNLAINRFASIPEIGELAVGPSVKEVRRPTTAKHRAAPEQDEE